MPPLEARVRTLRRSHTPMGPKVLPPATAPIRGPRKATESPDLGARKRILVVDDDEDIRTTMRDVLSLMLPDLQVSICASGEEALAMLRGAPRFEAVLTDYQMPGMDGLALLDAVHAMHPALPVVLATACSGDETRELAVRKGAFAFLSKPFSVTDLVEAARAALHAGARTLHVRPAPARRPKHPTPSP